MRVAVWAVLGVLFVATVAAWNVARSRRPPSGRRGVLASAAELRRLSRHDPTLDEVLAYRRAGTKTRAANSPEAFVAAARRAADGTLSGEADAAEIAEESGAPLPAVLAAIEAAMADPPKETS